MSHTVKKKDENVKVRRTKTGAVISKGGQAMSLTNKDLALLFKVLSSSSDRTNLDWINKYINTVPKKKVTSKKPKNVRK